MKKIDSNKIFFYTIGSVPDKKIHYITAVGKYKNKWVLVQKRNTKIYEFPGGKRLNQEKIIDTLAREVKEEIGANTNRAIPISLYRFISYHKDYYGLVHYCEFNDLNGTYDQNEISDIKFVSEIKNSKINPIHFELFSFVAEHRRVKNTWFFLDNRESFGRTKTISVGGKIQKINQNIADPMYATKTIPNFFEKYVKNDIKGPIQLDINPTSACSDNCLFCFNKDDRHSDRSMLDYQKVLSVIDFLCENTNLMHIKSSGFGDPLCYPDLWDIFKFSKLRGLVTSLNTNGNNLSKHYEEILKYIDSIRFSIDSWGEDQFKEIHGIPGFTARKKSIECLSKIRELTQSNLIIGMHYVILPNNLNGLGKMVKWAITHKIDYIDITLSKFIPSYISSWDDKAIKAAIIEINKLKKYVTPDFNIIFPADVTVSDKKLKKFRNDRIQSKHPCWQIYLRHYISPSGEYGACNAFDSQPIAKRVFGNINSENIEQILMRINNENPLVKKDPQCRNCVIPHGIFNDLCDFVYENTNIKSK